MQNVYSSCICDALLFGLLIWGLLYFNDPKAKCGIPVLSWNIVYLSSFMANSLLRLGQIAVMRYCPRRKALYTIACFALVNLFMVAWLIYGNVLFYSEENDCRNFEETLGLSSMMFFFIIIGYVQFVGLLVLICFGACLLLLMRFLNERQVREISSTDAGRVVESLTRENFDPNVHKFEHTCAICMVDYLPEDTVTGLKCH